LRRAARDAAAAERDAEQALFAALAHPTRREILLVLQFRGGAMTAGKIAERFSCRWPTITRHLGALMQSRIVTVRRAGRTRVYSLDRHALVGGIERWSRWFRGPRRGR
jgi:DNA-binding transcriptional ArsR family regulator